MSKKPKIYRIFFPLSDHLCLNEPILPFCASSSSVGSVRRSDIFRAPEGEIDREEKPEKEEEKLQRCSGKKNSESKKLL